MRTDKYRLFVSRSGLVIHAKMLNCGVSVVGSASQVSMSVHQFNIIHDLISTFVEKIYRSALIAPTS